MRLVKEINSSIVLQKMGCVIPFVNDQIVLKTGQRQGRTIVDSDLDPIPKTVPDPNPSCIYVQDLNPASAEKHAVVMVPDTRLWIRRPQKICYFFLCNTYSPALNGIRTQEPSLLCRRTSLTN